MRISIVTTVLAAAVLVTGSFASAQNAEEKAMAQKVAAHLKQSGQLVDYRVRVKYRDGVAWLGGSVTDEQQRATAARLTRQIDGISHVVNKLQLTGQDEKAAEPVQLASTDIQQRQPNNRVANRLRPGSSLTDARPQPLQRQPLAANSAGRGMPLPAQRIGTRMNGGQAPIRPASASSFGAQQANYAAGCPGGCAPGGHVPGAGGYGAAYSYDNAAMPAYAWPSYASYPNYAGLTYPRQYSPTAWPYIGPFYPYPQVPLGWRKVCLEWDDGWWFLDFSDCNTH